MTKLFLLLMKEAKLKKKGKEDDAAGERTCVLLHGRSDLSQGGIELKDSCSDSSCVAKHFHRPETSPGLKSSEIINRSLTT